MRTGKKVKNGTDRKTKPCFVRLAKVRGAGFNLKTASDGVTNKTSSPNSNDEKMHKKLTGPIKKRPIVSSAAVTPRSTSNNEESGETIAAGRSRRAPKPNPKYSNDDIVTPKYKLQSGDGSVHHRSRGNGEYFEDSSDTDDFYNKDDSSEEGFPADDNDEIFEVEDSGSDFEEPKIVPRRRPGRPRRVPTPDTPELLKVMATRPPPRPLSRQSLQHPIAIRKNSIISNPNSSANVVPKMKANTATNMVNTSAELLGKKRKLNQTDLEKERDNILARNKRLNIALYDSNDDNSVTIGSNRVSLGANAKSENQSNIRKTQPTNSTSQTKKMVISLSPNSPTSTQQSNARKSTPNNMAVSGKLSLSAEKDSSPKMIIKQQQQNTKGLLKATPNTNNKSLSFDRIRNSLQKERSLTKGGTKNINEKTSSTKDDFEMMPTFTIVNINDIINKKGDVLIHKAQISEGNSKLNTNESQDQSLTPSSGKSTPVLCGPTTANSKLNRRKAGHTTILSEKIDPTRLKNPPPRSQFPPPTKKPVQKILNHTLLNNNSSRSMPKLLEKPAPRILNSVVGKKTLPVQPLISKCKDPDDPDSPDDNFSLLDENESPITPPRLTQPSQSQQQQQQQQPSRNSIINQRSPYAKKGPTISNNNNLKAKVNANNKQHGISPSSTTTKTIQRKLPPERVVVSRQGNKIIKKITCFETWYVINIPDDPPPKIIKNSFEMALISLANTVDSIKLPSTSWSYKVNLYQVSPQMLTKGNFALFTGDIAEHAIPEEDRSKYQPSSVMFRRIAKERPKSRLPYDRAVIFKNKTFFTNIDGKNVKFLGAPTNISSLEEIEVLLELVDELSLQSPFVEQTSTI